MPFPWSSILYGCKQIFNPVYSHNKLIPTPRGLLVCTNRGVFECFNIRQTSIKKNREAQNRCGSGHKHCKKRLAIFPSPVTKQTLPGLHWDLHPSSPEPPDCTLGPQRPSYLSKVSTSCIDQATSEPVQRLNTSSVWIRFCVGPYCPEPPSCIRPSQGPSYCPKSQQARSGLHTACSEATHSAQAGSGLHRACSEAPHSTQARSGLLRASLNFRVFRGSSG